MEGVAGLDVPEEAVFLELGPPHPEGEHSQDADWWQKTQATTQQTRKRAHGKREREREREGEKKRERKGDREKKARGMVSTPLEKRWLALLSRQNTPLYSTF